MLKRFLYLCVFSSVFLLFLQSCSSESKTEDINRIDSLVTVLDSLQIMLNTIDTAEIQIAYKIYAKNIEKIRTAFDEKNDKDIWQVLTRYGLSRKPLRDYMKHYNNYMSDIQLSYKQLNALKKDIKANVLKDEEIKKYTSDEAEIVRFLHISVSHLVENTKRYYDVYLELNPQVETLLSEDKI